jgi:class 3 adenylate cyclase
VPRPRDVRKVVTILFCDLIGSTAIGDRTDPETLRVLMRRYYETARTVLERHGGTVEKFVGDAVMAVFGIPIATEDDALRAVRAAVELRDTVHELGLDARIGVNTGDVVAGEGDTFVTGDAVNVAARLEQSAGAGEILLGGETLELVRDATTSQPIALDLKGKPEPIVAHRLLSLDVSASGISRRLDQPIVGRERERQRLRADFDDAVASQTPRLFTLVGPAGVGKSRLVADFLEHLGPAVAVARGRARSYGEGITYWPLAEILEQLGIEAETIIRSSPADTQLAARALFERLAAQQPLVVVVDDLHWAEAPMLDLVEHVVDWAREAPIFLLCVARPELLDTRPGWAGGKLNATSILLEPLSQTHATQLADDLLRDVPLSSEMRSRIIEIAEGNPLFLEEMAALALEDPELITVPPTIHAVLQARIDALNAGERSIIERAAVEGKVFHQGSVTALSPRRERERVPGDLLALVRKELVRPDRSQIADEDAFRFRHLLIRDTAYASLPKAVRADLHERFAEWLDAHPDLAERDEIVGYHLEQAMRYLNELGTPAERVEPVAKRAAARLAAGGRAADDRADVHAAVNLLGRSIALLADGQERREMLPDYIEAVRHAGQEAEALRLAAELRAGDELDRARATALQVWIYPLAEGRAVEDAGRDLAEAEDVIARRGSDMDHVRLEVARGQLAWVLGQALDSHRAMRHAYELLGRMGLRARQARLLESLIGTAVYSGLPAQMITALLDELTSDLEQGAGPLLRSTLDGAQARNAYMRCQIEADEARRRLREQAQMLREVGSDAGDLGVQSFLAVIDRLEGDLEAAELGTRQQLAAHQRLGMQHWLANGFAQLSMLQSRRGEIDEARSNAARARELLLPGDVADEIAIHLAEALVVAKTGEHARARELVDRARRASATIVMAPLSDEIEATDATVRRLGGDLEGAERVAQQLVETCERRGLIRFASAYRRQLGLVEPTASQPS